MGNTDPNVGGGGGGDNGWIGDFLLGGTPGGGTVTPPGSSLSRLMLGPSMDSTKLSKMSGSGPTKFQPDFPPAARELPLLRQGKLSRGAIYQDKNDPLVDGRPLGFQFLYNPTEFEQDYSLDTSRYPTSAAPQAGSGLPAYIPGASTIAFNLILDRTWDVNNPRAGSPYRKGIRVDVEHFEKMVGYSRKSPFVQAVSMWIDFGHPTLRFFGYISSFAALYSQFTTDMRCYRGALTGISFQIMPYYGPEGVAGGQALATANEVSGGDASAPNDDGTGRKKKHKPTVPHGA